MKLSYTALKTFQECHFRFSLRYHRGLASRPRPLMRLSRALHGALQLFHQDLKQKKDGERDLFPIPAPLDSLLSHFTRYYENPTRPLNESQYQEGKKLLTRYWEAHGGKFPTPYLLEEPFSLHVGPFLLTGHFDRVDAIDRTYEIIDYKLSQRSPLPPDPLQLDVYQLGFHAKTGEVAKKLSFFYLRLGQKETIEQEEVEAARAQVRALCRDIAREQEFRPHEGAWCGGCDFWEFCPAKAKSPRPVPAGGRARQLGFDFGG
jgi:RecB family exonuclease